MGYASLTLKLIVRCNLYYPLNLEGNVGHKGLTAHVHLLCNTAVMLSLGLSHGLVPPGLGPFWPHTTSVFCVDQDLLHF